MNYQNIYEDIISDLKNSKRPFVDLDFQELSYLNAMWGGFLDQLEQGHLEGEVHSNAKSEIEKILCILAHSKNMSPIFNDHIYRTIKQIDDPDTLIYTLSTARKHIIQRLQRHGEPIPYEFIENLKELLLEVNQPELMEWVLRTVEELGKQSLILKEDVLKKKPNFLARFNKHKQASKQIIELLEKRWAPFTSSLR